MGNHLSKVCTLFFPAAFLIFLSGSVNAQEDSVICTDIDLIVEQVLPQGVSLEDATDAQIDSAIYQALGMRPGAGERIVSCACARRPDKASVIVFAAVRAQPDKKDELVAAAKKVAPVEQARGIERAGQAAFDLVSQRTASEGAVSRGYSSTYREWSPIPSKEDSPDSPFAP